MNKAGNNNNIIARLQQYSTGCGRFAEDFTREKDGRETDGRKDNYRSEPEPDPADLCCTGSSGQLRCSGGMRIRRIEDDRADPEYGDE